MIFSLLRAWDKGRVVTYTVHEQDNPVADRMDRAEELAFVKDGFNFSAAVLAPVWLLANGVWLAFLGYVVVASGIVGGVAWLGIGGVWPVVLMAGLHLLIGAEADSLKRFALEQSGWQTVGTVVGRNASECERRFFETWLESQPLLRRGGAGAGSGSGSGVGLASSGAGVAGVGASAIGSMEVPGGGSAPVSGGRRWWPFGA